MYIVFVILSICSHYIHMHIIQINVDSAHIPTPVQEEESEEAGKKKNS